ncbi:MAG: hypothetical protein ACLUJR_13390 [Mediterraneibacter gnavus]
MEKGETFFSPAYTLLSLSYDQVFEPKAEKAAEGVCILNQWEKTHDRVYL